MKVLAEVTLELDIEEVDKTIEEYEKLFNEVFESGCESCCASGYIKVLKVKEDTE